MTIPGCCTACRRAQARPRNQDARFQRRPPPPQCRGCGSARHFVGDHRFRVFAGVFFQLIVRVNGARAQRAVEAALGLVDVLVVDRRADVFERQPKLGQRALVDLDADGGLLAPDSVTSPTPVDLGKLLRDTGVGEVLYAR